MQVQELKKNAEQMLRRGNYSVRKLTAIHAGALVGISLLTPVLSLLLENYGGSGGGLDGLGSYALVATAQVVLMLAVVLAELFWSVGYQNAALEYVNGQNVTPGSLLAGFRRWGAVLVSTLLVAFLLVGRGFIAENIRDSRGIEIETAPHPSMFFRLKVPFAVRAGDIMRLG